MHKNIKIFGKKIGRILGSPYFSAIFPQKSQKIPDCQTADEGNDECYCFFHLFCFFLVRLLAYKVTNFLPNDQTLLSCICLFVVRVRRERSDCISNDIVKADLLPNKRWGIARWKVSFRFVGPLLYQSQVPCRLSRSTVVVRSLGNKFW